MKLTSRMIVLCVALMAVVTLACGGGPSRPSVGGGAAYNPFYEGHNQAVVDATPESATPASPSMTGTDTKAPLVPTPTALVTTSPATSTVVAEVTVTVGPAGPGYIDLVAQSLSLIEDQRPAFFGSLANLPVSNWEGVVTGVEMVDASAILVVNLIPMTDGSQDGPDARLDLSPDLAVQFNSGERVRFSGTVRNARSEPGTDLLLEIGDTTVEKVQ